MSEHLTELYKQAIEFYKKGDRRKAFELLEFIGCRAPGDPHAAFSLACIYHEDGLSATAMHLLHRCLDLGAKWPEVYCNLGVCYRRSGHEKRAQEIYSEGLKLSPNDPLLLANMSGAFVNWGAPELAVEWADKCLKVAPDNKQAMHHKALGLLELGRFDEGWRLYDARFHTAEHQPYKRPYDKHCQRWNGEKVKRLLVHGEQGLGDEILFCGWLSRCLPLADEVVVEATPRLIETFARTWPTVKFLATPDECLKTGAFDAYIAMGSLPQIFGTENRDKTYLKADPEKVAFMREKLAEIGPGPYVGLSWYGGSLHTHGYLRAAHPDMWKPLLEYGTPISAQYGESGEKVSNELGLVHWPWVVDMPETLIHLIAALDVVVTANQTNVHIAGALGKPCFTLTPSKPAWRYQLRGDGMLWYDSVRQFRQFANDWKPAFEKVEKALADFTRISGDQQKAA